MKRVLNLIWIHKYISNTIPPLNITSSFSSSSLSSRSCHVTVLGSRISNIYPWCAVLTNNSFDFADRTKIVRSSLQKRGRCRARLTKDWEVRIRVIFHRICGSCFVFLGEILFVPWNRSTEFPGVCAPRRYWKIGTRTRWFRGPRRASGIDFEEGRWGGRRKEGEGWWKECMEKGTRDEFRRNSTSLLYSVVPYNEQDGKERDGNRIVQRSFFPRFFGPTIFHEMIVYDT